MRLIAGLGLALTAALPVAAPPLDPVRSVLAAASGNWEPGIAGIDDRFGENRPETLHTKAFAKSCRGAWALATADDGGIFEMVFLVNAQAACRFENMRPADKADADGVHPSICGSTPLAACRMARTGGGPAILSSRSRARTVTT